VAAYADDAIALRRLVDEAELKRTFLDAVFALLTDAQGEALRPAAARGRVAVDLFSEGLVWVGRAQPIAYRDAAHLAELIGTRIVGDVDAPARARTRPIVDAWVAGLPDDLLAHEPDELDRMGMIDAALATRWGRATAGLVERLLRDADLDERATSHLHDLGGALVPFRDASE
jgi:hypothetical protein